MEKTTKHIVEDRLIALKSLKDNEYNLTSRALDWKKKANAKEVTNPKDENDYRTQVSATVKRQKDAELSANMPEFNFIPLSDSAERNRKIFKETWKYWWLKTNTDKKISQVIRQATTYGTGILYEGIKHINKTIKEPYKKDGLIEFREKNIIKSELETRRVPFLNFFINGTDIDEATEFVEIQYFDRTHYINERKDSPLYKNISKLKESSTDYILSGITDGKGVVPNQDSDNLLTQIEYFNEATDEHIILANGIEILNAPIPYAHKKAPYDLYIDNEAEDRLWGIGEFELLEPEERAKNEYRSLTIKAVKASIGFILKENNCDLETDDLDYGIQEVYETDDLDSIKHFAPSVPIGAVAELEAKIDNDIISKSGIDFKALQLNPSESATRTANKSLSTKKRINNNIKDNGYSFFRRLGELRLSNIQQLHEMEDIRIPVEGGSISPDGIFVSDETSAYGSAIIGKKFVEGDFLVIPITETMLGNSEQRRKDNLTTFMQVSGNLVGENGQPVIKGSQLAQLACNEYGYDYEKLTEETSDSQSTQDIVDEVFEEGNQLPPEATDPNYIPPSQRSGAKQQVNAISGQAKINDPDLANEL